MDPLFQSFLHKPCIPPDQMWLNFKLNERANFRTSKLPNEQPNDQMDELQNGKTNGQWRMGNLVPRLVTIAASFISM